MQSDKKLFANELNFISIHYNIQPANFKNDSKYELIKDANI